MLTKIHFSYCVSIVLKGKFYKTTIQLAMLYGTEWCWVIKKQYIHKMSVAEMRILSWISWNAQKDRIRNKEICLKILMKRLENCLRWFGHVQRKAVNAFLRVSRSKLSELKNVEEDPI